MYPTWFAFPVRKRKEPSALHCGATECFGLRDLTLYRYYKLLTLMLCVSSDLAFVCLAHRRSGTCSPGCLLCVNNRCKISFEAELEAVMTRQIIPEIFSLCKTDVACRLRMHCNENICSHESTNTLKSVCDLTGIMLLILLIYERCETLLLRDYY